nr:ATP-binding cassette domain-containing protein [Alphaproteobacteria bacterium]
MQKQADAILPLKEISKSPAVLELKAVTKVFPGVKALSEVSLKLIPGEVTALVGENGAGKSTVVKILTGIYQPDDGIILVDGQPTIFPVPQAASQSGVTAIHQETVLFDELSVAENIFLGHAPRGRFGLIDLKIMNKKSCDILHSIGARIDPEQKLKDLGIANKHLVAIARALSTDARVVIILHTCASLH